MISGKFHTNDGELVFIRHVEDFARLVESKIGYDAAQMVRELAKMAADVQQRLDSDLRSYESQLDSQATAFQEIWEHVHRLLNIVHRAKIAKVEKEEILRSLKAIKVEVANQL